MMANLKVDHQFVYSGNKSQQLRDVVEQLRREGKVVLVVKPGEPVSVLDSDFIIYDEDPKHWEGRFNDHRR
jgi:hypothetical protein